MRFIENLREVLKDQQDDYEILKAMVGKSLGDISHHMANIDELSPSDFENEARASPKGQKENEPIEIEDEEEEFQPFS